MTGLDRAQKRITLGATRDDEGREITPAADLAYDTLVIAIGSVINDFGTPGAAEHAVPLETPDQASRFNRRLVNACLRANAQDGPVRPGQLHVAIIGAGATGTELAAELHRTVRAVVAYGMNRIDPARDIRIVLIEAAPCILPALPERILAAMATLLAALGVIVRAGARVAEVRAACLLGDSGATIPPRAQAAHQQASHMVRTLRGRLGGLAPQPFVYRDFGSLVSLGRYSTVGSLMGFMVGRSLFIEGYFARMVYRSLYKMHQTALHGSTAVLWRLVARYSSQSPEPSIKLH